jgi:hypothetical protein
MTTLDLRDVRAIVTDADVLGRIDPAAVAACLQRTGWFQAHERANGVIWTRWLDDHAAKLFVPNDPTFGDYAIRMSEVLAALALSEDRSQLAVLVDLYGESTSALSGAERIAAERRRQVDEEGRTPEHDDGHIYGELARAGAAYVAAAVWPDSYEAENFWPWDLDGLRFTDDSIRKLVKAGALIAAEIDRLLREAARHAEVEP